MQSRSNCAHCPPDALTLGGAQAVVSIDSQVLSLVRSGRSGPVLSNSFDEVAKDRVAEKPVPQRMSIEIGYRKRWAL